MEDKRPKHYSHGNADHFDNWYERLPFDEFKTVMRAYAEKYVWREKESVVEDIDKSIYILQRLKKYIHRHEMEEKTAKAEQEYYAQYNEF